MPYESKNECNKFSKTDSEILNKTFYEETSKCENSKEHRTNFQQINNNFNFIINLNENTSNYQNVFKTDEIKINSYYNYSSNNYQDNNESSNTGCQLDNNEHEQKNGTDQTKLNYLINMCKSQVGCRKLQNKLYSNRDYANSYLYPLLKCRMLELINDHIGNYLYQQFLDVLNKENLRDLIKYIFCNFNSIAFSPNGTRIVQKLIDNISQTNNDLFIFVYELLHSQLKNNIAFISTDENANHIVQKFLICIKSPYTNFIYDEIINNFVQISTTKYGCCVVQKCLLHGNQEQREKIIICILNNTYKLIVDQFGNYVYQSLINTNEDRIIYEIYRIISPNFILLCKQKYSSNVIEKLFDINNKNLVYKIAKLVYNNEKDIIELLTDQYGNYIIQKIMDCLENKVIIQTILYFIISNVHFICQTSFGKSLLNKLSKKHILIANVLSQKKISIPDY